VYVWEVDFLASYCYSLGSAQASAVVELSSSEPTDAPTPTKPCQAPGFQKKRPALHCPAVFVVVRTRPTDKQRNEGGSIDLHWLTFASLVTVPSSAAVLFVLLVPTSTAAARVLVMATAAIIWSRMKRKEGVFSHFSFLFSYRIDRQKF
jgi:hypothetical protein